LDSIERRLKIPLGNLVLESAQIFKSSNNFKRIKPLLLLIGTGLLPVDKK